jgi:hypothetical protein
LPRYKNPEICKGEELMCNCYSYNGDISLEGKTPQVVMPPPESWNHGRDICIDACISETIGHVWRSGIYTLNSCCGHGKDDPTIIVEQNCSKDEANRIRAIIAEVDSRKFKLISWTLTEI